LSRLPVSVFGSFERRSSAGRSGVAQSHVGAIHQDTSAFAEATRQGCFGFVGDHRQWVTPVPIPNTEVKPLSPMILLSGKVGYRRLYEPRQVTPGEALFVFGFGVAEPGFARHHAGRKRGLSAGVQLDPDPGRISMQSAGSMQLGGSRAIPSDWLNARRGNRVYDLSRNAFVRRCAATVRWRAQGHVAPRGCRAHGRFGP
jgi:hypothetical protein